MDFKQQKKVPKNEERYHFENLQKAREFSKQFLDEMGELVRSIVIFGSNANATSKKDSDIDIMIVLDNVSVYVSEELREAYRIITEKITSQISDKFHLMTINLTDFWDMSRKGDPILINVLRYGMPLFDRDLVEPMQYLLEIGKIRPTRESVSNYKTRSQTLFNETTYHLQEALLDLYYSVVDAVHASLMSQGVTPPSPKEMPELFSNTFKNSKSLLDLAPLIEEFYEMEKSIEHKEAGRISGKYFDEMKKKADKIIKKLNNYTTKQLDKKDIFEL